MFVAIANGWDGIYSALVSGAVSALVVLLGVGAAHRLSQKAEARRDLRASLDALALRVADLHDTGVRSRSAGEGKFQLYPLRQQLMVSRTRLGEQTEPYLAAKDFYDAAADLRAWVRLHPKFAHREATVDGRHLWGEYNDRLDQFGREVIDHISAPVNRHHRPRPPRPHFPQLH